MGTANPTRNDPDRVEISPVSHGNTPPPLAVTANTHPVLRWSCTLAIILDIPIGNTGPNPAPTSATTAGTATVDCGDTSSTVATSAIPIPGSRTVRSGTPLSASDPPHRPASSAIQNNDTITLACASVIPPKRCAYVVIHPPTAVSMPTYRKRNAAKYTSTPASSPSDFRAPDVTAKSGSRHSGNNAANVPAVPSASNKSSARRYPPRSAAAIHHGHATAPAPHHKFTSEILRARSPGVAPPAVIATVRLVAVIERPMPKPISANAINASACPIEAAVCPAIASNNSPAVIAA